MPRSAARLFIVLAALSIVARPAAADVVLVPYIGQSWSGVINDAGGGYPTTVGARLEWFGSGILGAGVDVARAEDFLGEAQGRVRDSALTSVMANVVVGGLLPEGRGFRPYLSGGVGLLRYELTRTSGGDASKTEFGYNFGAGADVFFNRHIGAQLDFRYIRNTQDFLLGGLDFEEGILEYARWSAGAVIRF